MKSLHFLLPLVGFSAALGLVRRDESVDEATNVSDRYIVEVAEGTDLDALEATLLSNPDTTVFRKFNHKVFKALSIVSTSENTESLSALEGVQNVWQSGKVVLEVPEARTEEAEVAQVAQAQDAEANAIPDLETYNLHTLTGVNRVHDAGYAGQGVKVAVIDTGVFYGHPALGGGYGPGFKVSGGYDLVGSTYPTGPIEPDDDPHPEERDPDWTGLDHGTHAAGIIAGESEWFTGVAPQVEILAYKVFGHRATSDEEVFIDAFLRAYDDGADVISASIGMPGGISDNAWATVGSRLVDEGVVVVVAAGNNGREGPFYLDAGASGKNVIAAASISPPHLPGDYHVNATFEDSSVVVMPMMVARIDGDRFRQANGFPIWSQGLGFTACEALPEDVDLSSVVVLVSQASCSYQTKVENLVARNGTFMLFYNDEKALHPPDPTYPGVSVEYSGGIIEKTSAEAVYAALDNGETVTATISEQHEDHSYNLLDPWGGKPAYSTSWGPLYDLDVKPDIGAYGVDIRSTAYSYYERDGGREFIPTWRTYSGTSFATPYIAGVAALWISRFGGRSTLGPEFAKDLTRRIITSGGAVPWGLAVADGDAPNPNVPPEGATAPVVQVGNGMIDAWKIFSYTTTLNFEKFALNDTANFVPTHSLEIRNGADEPLTYSFSHQALTGFEARAPEGLDIVAYNQLKAIEIAANVELPDEITIQPGDTATVEFTFAYPSYEDTFRMPCYNGKIWVHSSADEELSIPYFGAAFDLKESVPLVLAPGKAEVVSVEGPSNYTFEWFDQTMVRPRVSISTLYPTRELRWDIFESGWTPDSWTYPPVAGENGYVGSVLDILQIGGRNFPQAAIPFPIRNFARTPNPAINSDTGLKYAWDGRMADGSNIEPGTYAVRIAALRPFGDPAALADWDVLNTPEITVNSV